MSINTGTSSKVIQFPLNESWRVRHATAKAAVHTLESSEVIELSPLPSLQELIEFANSNMQDPHTLELPDSFNRLEESRDYNTLSILFLGLLREMDAILPIDARFPSMVSKYHTINFLLTKIAANTDLPMSLVQDLFQKVALDIKAWTLHKEIWLYSHDFLQYTAVGA